MSQAKVTEFFLNRKRGGSSYQASKRLKVTLDSNLQEETVEDKLASSNSNACLVKSVTASASVALPYAKFRASNTKPLTNSKARGIMASKSDKKATKTVSKSTNQLSKYLLKSSTASEIKGACLPKNSDDQSSNALPIISIPTAVHDDHGTSPSASPVKRPASESSGDISKRGHSQTELKGNDVYKTPEKFDFTPYAEHNRVPSGGCQLSSARKKLTMHRSIPSPKESSPVFDFKGNTPEKQPLTASSVVTSSESTLAGEKLGKCKSLAELRQKLAQFAGKKAKAGDVLERAHRTVEKRKNAECEVQASNEIEQTNAAIREIQRSPAKSVGKAPAHERYSSLAVAGPPTFQLPHRYRILSDTFQSTDTIVSMLTNRSEICTFSKLKAAVQEMTKRAFEVSHLGQMKTVYPTAYCFRQEKDLPIFGGKASGYQLTIEPVVDDLDTGKTRDKRMIMSVTKLTERKNFFLHNLVNIVKKYHKEFLEKLNIQINEAEIKRWHPKFKLDDVADIEPAELPQPPFTKKFSTAKDVLNEVKDKINPRIQKALEIVSNKSPVKDVSKHKSVPDTDLDNIRPKISLPLTEDESNRLNSFKGIPTSLLERVRAKQVKKLEQEMTRSSEDTKRLEMLQRLPELTRILRTHFVTQKRPALPLMDVVKSFTNSYKSTLGLVEAEIHLKMIAEVVPDWMRIVHLKSGSFVKIDRDVDLMSVHDKIQNMIKAI